MSVRKEAWKNPEIATQEELLEMFLKQRAWQRAAKKKAAKANSELEKHQEAWLDTQYFINMALMRFRMHETATGEPLKGVLGYAKANTMKALEFLRKVHEN